ncbi:cysteine-rich receptor-like protein kinase 15 [Prosopis cineraria]|uniref:cysteine-rich receptor-like protein kinase 15 n=1 Tax=Prosopis cineraria TaxID=364024 RepID=UPI00240FF375|nr:cysteine-rich receptor-like protein kinase 15 [Prosopis cineraria]
MMGDIQLCCLGRDGRMVLCPSCSLMLCSQLFYREVEVVPACPPGRVNPDSVPTDGGKGDLGSAPAIGTECTTLESLQFDFATIEAATNRLSAQNRIGQGGFGKIYKGTLSNGQKIAMKRLSASSKQGTVDFK